MYDVCEYIYFFVFFKNQDSIYILFIHLDNFV